MDYSKYGVTDMSGLEQPLDYDGDSELKGPQLGPMPEGNYVLSLRPRMNAEGQFLSVRTGKRGPFVLANVQIRYWNADAQKEGSYLGTNFLNTIQFSGQTTSDLVFLCKIAGNPAPKGLNAVQLAEHIDKVLTPYAESEGAGLLFMARTVWELSHKETDESGEPFLQDGKAVYFTLKGKSQVQEELRNRAVEDAKHLGLTGDTAAEWVEERVTLGMYVDPVTGDDRQVRTILSRIIGEPK